MAKNNPSQSHLCEAILQLAAKQPWNTITLDVLAKKAKLPLAFLKKTYSSPDMMVPELIKHIDHKVSQEFTRATKATNVRERLFDVLMARFDALQIHRQSYINIAKASRKNPRLAILMLKCLHTSMKQALSTIDSKAVNLEAAGLLAIYGLTFATWERDTSPDLAKTMAALDRHLRYADKTVSYLEKFSAGKRAA